MRRHSSTYDAEAVFVRVDLFLSELERRLDWLDNYRKQQLIQFDARMKRGYSALEDVRDSCSHASGELMGAAKQRAKILVETLEGRYNDVIATKETLEAKAQASMKLMEGYLTELEHRAHSIRNTNLSSAVEEGWRKVDEGLTHAREAASSTIDGVRLAKDALREGIDHALARAKESRLIHYSDLPDPWRVNPHIVKGYRFHGTKLECLTSAFKPHNETVNIWSHAIGLLIVLSIAFYFYPTSPTFPLSTKTDVIIAACFFAAAAKCLICSCMWHTMNSIADVPLLERFACVDYTGISFLVAASILSTEWTAFYCDPVSRSIYMCMTATLGIAGTILPWHPTFNRADMAWLRVAFYVTLAVTGFLPVLQLNLTRGSNWTYYFYAPIAKSMAVYLTGACIYASQIPERWSPGWFDFVGGSHNIWHFAVLGGILFHYMAMQEFFKAAFEMRGSQNCSKY